MHPLPVNRKEFTIDEIATALVIAQRIGLQAETAHLISPVGRTVVLLEPCRIVAKVSPLADRARCEKEVALASHVVKQQGPVAPPLLKFDPVPHFHDDSVVTFWKYCSSNDVSPISGNEIASAYSQLFPHLQSYSGDLPDFRMPIRACQKIVERNRPGNLDDNAIRLLGKEFDRLGQLEINLDDIRNLIGDPHDRNCVRSGDHVHWHDLKAACTGPIEWDLSALPPSSYQHPHRPDLLHQLNRLRSACVVVWCAVKETPDVLELDAIQMHLELLKKPASL